MDQLSNEQHSDYKELSRDIKELKSDLAKIETKVDENGEKIEKIEENGGKGEKGEIGTEEEQFLKPLIDHWRTKHPNITITGPLSPDTCWISAAQAWNKGPSSNTPNGDLAIYHDQGLIPLKMLAFDAAVNITLGLPFIRTSPDHGTAFDIAGKNRANLEPTLQSFKIALRMAKSKSGNE